MKKTKSKLKTSANKKASGGRSAPPCSRSSDTPETDKAWNDFRILPTCKALERERDELRRTNKGLQVTFDLRWKADQRARKRWQAAHPGSERTWLDHADMVVWLMESSENVSAMAPATLDADFKRDVVAG